MQRNLALSKLERNPRTVTERIFSSSFRAGLIDLAVLERRYYEELRPLPVEQPQLATTRR